MSTMHQSIRTLPRHMPASAGAFVRVAGGFGALAGNERFGAVVRDSGGGPGS